MKLFSHPALQLLVSLAQIYTGLGFLGVLPGFSSTNSVFSKVLGALFLIAGIATVVDVARKVKRGSNTR